MVRISKKKQIFEKGYLPNFTEEIFEIQDVIAKKRPYLYILKNLSGERIIGNFAPEEVQKVIKEDSSLCKNRKNFKEEKEKW